MNGRWQFKLLAVWVSICLAIFVFLCCNPVVIRTAYEKNCCPFLNKNSKLSSLPKCHAPDDNRPQTSCCLLKPPVDQIQKNSSSIVEYLNGRLAAADRFSELIDHANLIPFDIIASSNAPPRILMDEPVYLLLHSLRI